MKGKRYSKNAPLSNLVAFSEYMNFTWTRAQNSYILLALKLEFYQNTTLINKSPLPISHSLVQIEKNSDSTLGT